MKRKGSIGLSFRIGLASLIAFLLIGFPPLFKTTNAIQADSFLEGRHLTKGLTCVSCHKEESPRDIPSNSSCLICHGDQKKLVEKTNKVVPNPHASPHLDPGAPLACDECHHIHKSSKVSCLGCHQEFTFRNI